MRTRSSEPAKTMAQKIVLSHAKDAVWSAGSVCARVDQVVLSRDPSRVLHLARESHDKQFQVETSMAYTPHCLLRSEAECELQHGRDLRTEALALGFTVAKAGAGFAPPTHLERFAAPGRICLVDDIRMTGLGGLGVFTLAAAPPALFEALLRGQTTLRVPESIAVRLTGKFRSFVSAKDLGLELIRRDLAESVKAADQAAGSPIWLEFVGPAATTLSVPERAILSEMSTRLGAGGALFASDDRTESFLRDQRRSKAYRALTPDDGAPYWTTASVDLGTIEPLVSDESGRVYSVRELEGRPIDQVVVGGDSGASLRDLLTMAELLSGKRIASNTEFLIAPPSRQQLSVLSSSGALAQLVSVGGRLVEPDRRLHSGELHPTGPHPRLTNIEPDAASLGPFSLVASTETAALSVTAGELLDPRHFRRPARVAVPRQLPIEDSLILRPSAAELREEAALRESTASPNSSPSLSRRASRPPQGSAELAVTRSRARDRDPAVFITDRISDLQWLSDNAAERVEIRAVIAPHIPAHLASRLSGQGIFTLEASKTAFEQLAHARRILRPLPRDFGGDGVGPIEVSSSSTGSTRLELRWLCSLSERTWVEQGSDPQSGEMRTRRAIAASPEVAENRDGSSTEGDSTSACSALVRRGSNSS